MRPGQSQVDHGAGQRGPFYQQLGTCQAVGGQNSAAVLDNAILKWDGAVEIVLDDENRLTAQFCLFHNVTMSLDDADRLMHIGFQGGVASFEGSEPRSALSVKFAGPRSFVD